MSAPPFRLAVVGCGSPGEQHAAAAVASNAFAVVATCDLSAGRAESLAAEHAGARSFTDLAALLAETKPDVVTLATNEVPRARLALQALEAGVRGLYLEKPIAVHPRDARRLARECRERGVVALVNHQRRMNPPHRTLRRLIDEGALGAVSLLIGSAAGDLLADGTHTADLLAFFAGDKPVEWVLGQVHWNPGGTDEPRGRDSHRSGGYRYGRIADTSATGLIQFRDGPQAMLLSGAAQLRGLPYQSYEVLGSAGRARLLGPTRDSGPRIELMTAGSAGWREVPADPGHPLDDIRSLGLPSNYLGLADSLRDRRPHPLDIEHGLRAFELVTAIMESARIHRPVAPPANVERYPLEEMAGQGLL